MLSRGPKIDTTKHLLHYIAVFLLKFSLTEIGTPIVKIFLEDASVWMAARIPPLNPSNHAHAVDDLFSAGWQGVSRGGKGRAHASPCRLNL